MRDLFTTACQVGISSWARITEYHWSDQDYDGNRATLLDTVALYEDEKPAEECTYRLTAKAMSRTLRLIAEGRPFGLHPTWQARLAQLNRAAHEQYFGDVDYDATDADVLAQVTLLGKSIYG